MVEMVKRNDRTYAYDTASYSSAIVDLPILWQGFPEIGNTQASTTTTIGFVTRDPIGYHDGMSIYGSYMALGYIDPEGLSIGIGGVLPGEGLPPVVPSITCSPWVPVDLRFPGVPHTCRCGDFSGNTSGAGATITGSIPISIPGSTVTFGGSIQVTGTCSINCNNQFAVRNL